MTMGNATTTLNICDYANNVIHMFLFSQVQFMTYAFGGPEEYHGKDMWRAHEKLVRDKGLNDHHFDVIVKHLVGSLQKFNVPEVSHISLLLTNS